MAGRVIPSDLMILIGSCLRQARRCRNLSIKQASKRVKISSQRLLQIETGQEQITDVEAQAIIVRYGGARADRLDSLLYQWAMDDLSRQSKTDKRKHLSLVGEDPKPWEKPKKNWK